MNLLNVNEFMSVGNSKHFVDGEKFAAVDVIFLSK